MKYWVIIFLSVIHFLSAAEPPEAPAIESIPGSNAVKLTWPTKSGVRYELQESSDLVNWSTIPGFPVLADQLAQQQIAPLTTSPHFWRLGKIDEQPPVVIFQYPGDAGFSIPRMSTLSFTFSDSSGIDSSSIALSIGDSGPLTVSSPGVAYANNTLTYTPSTAMGPFGATITVFLAVADSSGNRLSRTYQFRLELEAQTASNIFVFGSTAAQSVGQSIANAGPTASLAAAAAPLTTSTKRTTQATSANNPWELASVLPDRITIIYSSSAPNFVIGGYLCNLTPSSSGQVFYRRILAVSDDSDQHVLTLFTIDVPLSELVQQGSATLGAKSYVYDTNAQGKISRALSAAATLDLGSIGFNASGASLYDDGVTQIHLKEAAWQFTPTLAAAIEIENSALTRTSLDATGHFHAACMPQITTAVVNQEQTFRNSLYETKRMIYLGQIGVVPIWLEVDFSLIGEVGFVTSSTLDISAGVSQDLILSCGVHYVKGAPPTVDWTRSANLSAPEILMPTYTLNGSASAWAQLTPKLDLKLESIAGISVNVAPRVEVAGSASISNNALTTATMTISATASLNVGLSVIDFSSNDLPHLSYPLYAYEKSAVYPLPNQIYFLQHPQNITAIIGESATLNCEAVGPGSITYQWYQNGIPIPGATLAQLHFSAISSAAKGHYFVRATGETAAADSSAVMVTVKSPLMRANYGPTIAGGGGHILFVHNDGTLWSTGLNNFGQLGDGTSTGRTVPIMVATDVIAVAAGNAHSLYLKKDGSLWTMGDNDYGQLGDGTTTSHATPTKVCDGVVAIAAQFQASFFVKSDGSLWGMGHINGSTTKNRTPVQISTDVLTISGSGDHTLIVKKDGTLWAQGINTSGQLGDGTTINRNTLVPITTDVVAVSAGDAHSLFLRSNGSLWAMGSNHYGQLGDGTNIDRHTPVQIAQGVKSMAAGISRSLYIQTDGSLWSMGWNAYGQLGDGTTTTRFSPIRVSSGALEVVNGYWDSLFLKSDGSLWGMGRNYYGELNSPPQTYCLLPIQVSADLMLPQ